LDIVRRDWSQFAADAGKAIIDIIMTDKSEDLRLSEIQVKFKKKLNTSPPPTPTTQTEKYSITNLNKYFTLLIIFFSYG